MGVYESGPITDALSPLAAMLRERQRERSSTESAPLVEQAHKLERLSKQVMNLAVTAERARGISWNVIGSTLGITRSSAHSRFAHLPEPALSAEEDLWGMWLVALGLAEEHLMPTAAAIRRLDPALRDQAARSLAEQVEDQTLDFDSRRLAALLYSLFSDRNPTLEAEHELNRMLPHALWAMPPDDDLAPAGTRQATRPNGYMIDRGAAARSDDLDGPQALAEEIEAYRALLDVGNGRAAGPSQRQRWGDSLATLLLADYMAHGDVSSLDESIAILRVQPHQDDDQYVGTLNREAALSFALQLRFQATGATADLDEAAMAAQRNVDDMEYIYGHDHPAALEAKERLADLLGTRGDFEAAVRLLRIVVRHKLDLYGFDHPETLTARYELARWCARTGPDGLRTAGNDLAGLLSEQTRLLGESHPDTQRTRRALLRNVIDGIRQDDEYEGHDLLADLTRHTDATAETRFRNALRQWKSGRLSARRPAEGPRHDREGSGPLGSP